MKRLLKISSWLLISIFTLVILASGFIYFRASFRSKGNMELLGPAAPRILKNGIAVRDLNKNGKIDPYEDPAVRLEDRVDDLIGQMTLEEKAGTMFITLAGTGPEGDPMEKPMLSSDPIITLFSFILPANSEMLVRKHMNSFNILEIGRAHV